MKKLLLGLLFSLPAHSLASNMTGLFLMFIVSPVIFLSLILLIVTWGLPKAAATSGMVLLGIHFLVFLWGMEVGGFGGAGWWLVMSFAVSLGILLRSGVAKSESSEEPPEIT